MFSRGVLLLWVALGLPASAGGEPAARAALAGRVLDSTGAPLPGVAVAVVTADGGRADAVTDAAGGYRLDGLPVGTGRATFSLVGFATLSRSDLRLAAGATTGLDVRLPVGLTSDVTVLGRDTFVNLAELDAPETGLVGFATSASQGAVTGRQIAARPLLRAAEILETVPGLIASQHSGEGKANQYYLRGFNLDHGTDFATSLAGMPVNFPTHAHGHGYTDVNFLMPELVAGVQYRKGPYGAEDGDFATAGSASIGYVTALDRPTGSVSGGGHGWQRVFAAASPRLGRGTLLAAIETARHDGPWLRPDDYRKVNVALRYSQGTAGSGWSITALGYDADWDATDQVPARAVASGRVSRFGVIDATDGGRTARYSLSGEWQRSDARTQTRVSAYGLRYRLNLFSNFTYFLDDPERGDQFEQNDRRTVVGATATQRRRGQLFGRAAEITLGTVVRHDRIGEVGLYHTAARVRLETVRADAVRQTSNAVFAAAEVRLHDRVRVTLGLRGDLYRFGVTAGDPRNSGRERAGVVSPKGGLVIGPFAKTEIYANAGRGFHSNDARGATLTVDPATGEPASRVTPLARATGAEIGLRSVLLPKVQTTLVVWRLDLASELVFAGDAGTTDVGRPSHRHGVEWATFLKPRRWLTMDVDLAVSRARFVDDDPVGRFVPGAVETVVSAGAAVDGPWRVSGGLRWRYVGGRPLREDDRMRSQPTGLVNGDVTVRLAPRARLRLELFNLLDARSSDVDYFYTSRLPGEPAAGVDDVHTHPAIPRTARLSLKLDF